MQARDDALGLIMENNEQQEVKVAIADNDDIAANFLKGGSFADDDGQKKRLIW